MEKRKNGEMTNVEEIRKEYEGIKGSHRIVKVLGKFPKDDLTGMKSGKLTAIKPVGRDSANHSLWLCECECKNNVILVSTDIKKKKKISCGCMTGELISKGRTNDLIGKTFRGVTVIGKAEYKIETDGHRRSNWLCKCNKCGEEAEFLEMNLKKGTSDICYNCRGVKRRTKHTLDLTGQTFNRWTVLRRATKEEIPSTKGGHSYWICRCLCGTVRAVSSTHLVSGASVSCGCYADDLRLKRDKFNYKTGKGWKSSEDLVGKQFGHLLVIKRVENYVSKNGKSSQAMYLCKCDCNNEITVSASRLLRGKATSCSCRKNKATSERCFVDLTGTKVGRLTVLERVSDHVYPSGKRRVRYRCQCSCGNTTVVLASAIVNKTTLSCGCLTSKGEEVIARILNENNIPFKKQKTFKDLISDKNAKLRFDFFVDGKYLIEFDGIYHYECSKRVWDTEEHFERTKLHDKMKNEYCKKNNIPLIRIPYTRLSKLCLEDLLLESSKFII